MFVWRERALNFLRLRTMRLMVKFNQFKIVIYHTSGFKLEAYYGYFKRKKKQNKFIIKLKKKYFSETMNFSSNVSLIEDN